MGNQVEVKVLCYGSVDDVWQSRYLMFSDHINREEICFDGVDDTSKQY